MTRRRTAPKRRETTLRGAMSRWSFRGPVRDDRRRSTRRFRTFAPTSRAQGHDRNPARNGPDPLFRTERGNHGLWLAAAAMDMEPAKERNYPAQRKGLKTRIRQRRKRRAMKRAPTVGCAGAGQNAGCVERWPVCDRTRLDFHLARPDHIDAIFVAHDNFDVPRSS